VKIIYTFIFAACMTLGTSVSAFAVPQVLDVATKQPVEYKEFISKVKGADVVFMGETHDEVKQHQNELDIIKSLHAVDGNVAIGLEMFSTDYQRQLDDWSNGKLDEQEFRAVYAKNWSYDWQLYRDIFIFARDNHIPMIALNVPKPIISKVARQGAAAVTDADKKELPPQINWKLNPQQAEYMRRIREQVFGNRPAPIRVSNFQEAQALRNCVMAWSISRFKEKSPKTRVISLTGTWHAVKNGAPEALKQYGNLTYKVVLPQLPELQVENVKADEADFLILK
jgi:uncharacterized iron-regulated protein